MPTERAETARDPVLISLRPPFFRNAKRISEDSGQRHPRFKRAILAPHEFGNLPFPWIALISLALLQLGRRLQRMALQPPRLALLVSVARLGPKLIAIECQPFDVDHPAGDRPKPTATG